MAKQGNAMRLHNAAEKRVHKTGKANELQALMMREEAMDKRGGSKSKMESMMEQQIKRLGGSDTDKR